MSREEALELAEAIRKSHARLRPEPYTIANGESIVRLFRKWQRRWVVAYILWEEQDWEDYLKGSVAA